MSSSSSTSDVTSNTSISSSSSAESNIYVPSAKFTNIIHFNAHSIKKKLNSLEAEVKGFDVVCLCETWLHDGISNTDIELHGFQPPFRNDRGDGYGGVAIYVRNNFIAKRHRELEDENLEAIWVEIHNGNLPCLVGCFYRPPTSKVHYWNLIETSLKKAKDIQQDNIFIVGDFNCDAKINNNTIDKLLDRNQFTRLNNAPTHITPTNRKIIDIAATTSPRLVDSCHVHTPSISNHAPISFSIKNSRQRAKTFRRRVWVFKDVDWGELNEDLTNCEWAEVIQATNADDMVKAWNKQYTDIVEQHIHRKTITIRQGEPKWMTPDIRHAIIIRNRLHSKAKRKDTPISWEKFKRQRNRVINKIRKAKQRQHKKNASFLRTNQKSNPKTWWKTVKSFYNTKCTKSDFDQPLIVDNHILTDEKDKANALNDFFASQSNLEQEERELPLLYPLNKNTIENVNITAAKVNKILQCLQTSKASGPDELNPLILKKTAKSISPIIAHIFNHSMKTSTFPSIWKLAHVTPLFKKGDRHNTGNYRPISLLSILSKVLERCVFDQVFEYFTENNIISKVQAAYIKNSGTELQLIEIYHRIVSEMDKGNMVRFIFCDISKAFDRVWHDGLMYKLERAGISGRLLKWFESYLAGRCQRVVIKGVKSDIKFLNAGVPQGSILGPLLFLLYINDITDVVSTNIRLYADDSSIFTVGKDSEKIAQELNSDLEQISKWAHMWRVNFNAKKTISITFTTRKLDHIVPLYLNNTRIVEKTSHKHLGCTLQSTGKWTMHVDDILNKCKTKVNMLRGLKYKLDRKTLEVLYTAYIRPVLEYASPVWTNCTQDQKNRIEEIQRESMRAITGGIVGTSHLRLYQECGWTSTHERRNRKNLTVFFKLVNRQTPEYMANLIPNKVQDKTTYNLRSSQDLSQGTTRSTFFQNSFIPSTTKTWNTLPQQLKNSKDINEFKRQINKDNEKTPAYYYSGNRQGQIIHTRMRLKCSPLNADLYDMHIIEDPSCSCGHSYENPEHFFFHCPRYNLTRQIFREIDGRINQDTRTFLYGSRDVDSDSNEKLFAIITKYICRTNRF